MSEILELSSPVTFFAATRYPSSNDEAKSMGLNGTRNKEMRAMTIAAFRIAQNNHQLSEAPMDSTLLLFLCANSTTALNYWKSKGRLVEARKGMALSPDGIAECQNTLLGRAGAYSTTEEKVSEWVERMLCSDAVALKREEFRVECWNRG